MNKSFAGLMTSLLFISAHSHAASPYFSLKDGDGFKRFSVSAGWLHAMPQGKANPVRINTPIAEGTQSKVGDVSTDSVLNAIDQSTVSGKAWYTLLNSGYKGLLEVIPYLRHYLVLQPSTVCHNGKHQIRALKPMMSILLAYCLTIILPIIYRLRLKVVSRLRSIF